MEQGNKKALTLKEEQKMIKKQLKVVKQDTKKIQKMLKDGTVSINEWDKLQELTDDAYYDYLHQLVNK